MKISRRILATSVVSKPAVFGWSYQSISIIVFSNRDVCPQADDLSGYSFSSASHYTFTLVS